MPPSLPQLSAQVDKLTAELDKRTKKHAQLESYYEGSSPIPTAVTSARVTQAYRRLVPVADAPWGSLVVGSVLDRLEIGGIQDPGADKSSIDAVWGAWQENGMDSESRLGHCEGLISGRAFALVWPDQTTGEPEISLDSSAQMIVQYAEGSRRHRLAAVRRWQDADTDQTMATLYRADGIYKFQQANQDERAQANWVMRQEPDEPWPVENPFGVVPVVEVRFNPRIKPGVFGYARGEYAHCLGLIDRINLLTFLGLVVAFWMGFPLRAVIGDKILRDDDGNVIPPFTSGVDSVAQFEDPNVKLDQYTAADRGNLSIYPELAQLAAITKTPRHYFPLAQAMANLSADAIRADEGALSAKVTAHKGFAGEDWEEVMRLCGLMLDKPLSPRAEIIWIDHESRSLAERADAATKLKDILPWQILAERVLNMTQDEIARVQKLKASDPITQLVVAAAQPPASNGTTPSAGAQETEPAAGGSA